MAAGGGGRPRGKGRCRGSGQGALEARWAQVDLGSASELPGPAPSPPARSCLSVRLTSTTTAPKEPSGTRSDEGDSPSLEHGLIPATPSWQCSALPEMVCGSTQLRAQIGAGSGTPRQRHSLPRVGSAANSGRTGPSWPRRARGGQVSCGARSPTPTQKGWRPVWQL